MGIQASKEKIKKREDQVDKSEGFVKKQKEELRKIPKEINPKLIKNLCNILNKKSPPKIVQMLEALVGLLKNSETTTSEDVEVYLH